MDLKEKREQLQKALKQTELQHNYLTGQLHLVEELLKQEGGGSKPEKISEPKKQGGSKEG